MIWRHTRRASRLIFFAFWIFAFRLLPIARLQGPPPRVLFRIPRRAGTFFVSLRGQRRTRRAASSWPLPFGNWNRLSAPHVPNSRRYPRWAVDTLTHTLTIQSKTFHLVQSGLNGLLPIVREISLVDTLRTSICPLCCSPIDSTIRNTFNSRDGAPLESASQPFKKLSSKTFNPSRRASQSGHPVSDSFLRSPSFSTDFSITTGARLCLTFLILY